MNICVQLLIQFQPWLFEWFIRLLLWFWKKVEVQVRLELAVAQGHSHLHEERLNVFAGFKVAQARVILFVLSTSLGRKMEKVTQIKLLILLFVWIFLLNILNLTNADILYVLLIFFDNLVGKVYHLVAFFHHFFVVGIRLREINDGISFFEYFYASLALFNLSFIFWQNLLFWLGLINNSKATPPLFVKSHKFGVIFA